MARKVTIQLYNGLERDIGLLKLGELGYCTDTQKLYIGTSSGNVLLIAAQTAGDMLKSIYDTDNDGIVDVSKKVNGFTVNANVPANAKFTDTIYTHPGSGTNPHGTTKTDLGLGSVSNYGIATQAEAQAGTSNLKYMTPLRVLEAITANALPKDIAITWSQLKGD